MYNSYFGRLFGNINFTPRLIGALYTIIVAILAGFVFGMGYAFHGCSVRFDTDISYTCLPVKIRKSASRIRHDAGGSLLLLLMVGVRDRGEQSCAAYRALISCLVSPWLFHSFMVSPA